MKAMILAAGFGTRLFPLTIDRTKPAIPFLGKPLVGYVAEYVAKFGFKDVVVNLHHQPQSVICALGDGSQFGVHIDYTFEEPEILGTAGALDNARRFLEDDTFLIVNGKIITDIDISAALETHRNSQRGKSSRSSKSKMDLYKALESLQSHSVRTRSVTLSMIFSHL
jgi:NDP-sugar pyrophosphorylase family protein